MEAIMEGHYPEVQQSPILASEAAHLVQRRLGDPAGVDPQFSVVTNHSNYSKFRSEPNSGKYLYYSNSKVQLQNQIYLVFSIKSNFDIRDNTAPHALPHLLHHPGHVACV